MVCVISLMQVSGYVMDIFFQVLDIFLSYMLYLRGKKNEFVTAAVYC